MDAIDEHATEMLLDGRYRLGPCLGRGGMAVVYRAEDTILGRTVAIKLLGSVHETSDDERVHNETTVLASLNHPSLVTLYDARLSPEHARYLAMEYVDGPTLASHLSHGPLSSLETASLARDLSEALQFVHDAGIIHRDVKPSNVMLARTSRRDAGWTAKLTDFGIAYSLADPRVTSPGIVVGTAAYMAPEQVRGADLTPAVDIYSLGLVLIEALSGEPAFPVTGRVPTALRRLSEAPAIPESLDPRWGTLLARMTRVNPEERPSAREVALASEFLRDDPSLQGSRMTPRTAPSALMPITAEDSVTGRITEIIAADETGTAPRRPTHRLRAGAIGVMTVFAASMIAFASFWAFSPPAESFGRIAPGTSADEVFAPPAVETTQPPVSDQTDSESETVNDVTEGEKIANPNKGPGANSGNQKDQTDDKKGK